MRRHPVGLPPALNRIRCHPRWIAWRPWVPGCTLFTLLYVWVALRGRFDAEAPGVLWQSLGRHALVEEPLRSLWVLHIQPPGLNALYMVAFKSGHTTLVLQSLFFLVGLGTVALIVDTLLGTGATQRAAAWAGTLYAALPSTVLYTLYPYNTTLVAFLLVLTVWAFARVTRGHTMAAVIVVLATLALFLIRPSFVWPFALACMFLPMVAVPRERARQFAALAAAGSLTVLSVQLHYTIDFGLPTTSSWAGENLVKGLLASGVTTQSDLTAAAGDDPCLASLATVFPFLFDVHTIDAHCFGSRPGLRGTAIALDERVKTDGPYLWQYNNVARLELAPSWNRLARAVLRRDPLAPFRMAFGDGPKPSGFELLLRPGHDYPFLAKNLRAGAPVTSALRPFGTLFPGLALSSVFVALFRIRRRRSQPASRVIILASAFVFYTALVGVFVEYGENMRFLTEAYPLLVCLLAWAVQPPPDVTS